MRILVTNDDGIDSIGLHHLARAAARHGEVVVAAPDSEYSGASAAIGALHLARPEIHKVHIDGIDEAWSVTGAPALCVMFARLGVFGGAARIYPVQRDWLDDETRAPLLFCWDGVGAKRITTKVIEAGLSGKPQ